MASRGPAVCSIADTVVRQVEAEWAMHLGRKLCAASREQLVRLREIIDDPFA